MQINIFCLTIGCSCYGITFGLAKRHQKSDEKVSGLDYDDEKSHLHSQGPLHGRTAWHNPTDFIPSPSQREPSRHSTSAAQLLRMIQMTERLVLSSDQGQACREKKNMMEGLWTQPRNRRKSWEADFGKKGGGNAHFLALTSAADT